MALATARTAGLPYGTGHLPVTYGLPERNVPQCRPNLQLKSRAAEVESDVMAPLFKHHFHYLACHFVVLRGTHVTAPAPAKLAESLARGGGNELQATYSCRCPRNNQPSERAFCKAIFCCFHHTVPTLLQWLRRGCGAVGAWFRPLAKIIILQRNAVCGVQKLVVWACKLAEKP